MLFHFLPLSPFFHMYTCLIPYNIKKFYVCFSNQNKSDFFKKSILLSLHHFLTEIPLTFSAAWANKNSHLCFSKKARDGESWRWGLYWEEVSNEECCSSHRKSAPGVSTHKEDDNSLYFPFQVISHLLLDSEGISHAQGV